MRFELISLKGTVFAEDVSGVTLNTADGVVGILPHHEPLTSIATSGPVLIHLPDGTEEVFGAYGGLLEVRPGLVRLLADETEHIDELIDSEIQAALADAKKLKAQAKNSHDVASAEQLIDRHSTRLGIAGLRRRRTTKRPTPIQK